MCFGSIMMTLCDASDAAVKVDEKDFSATYDPSAKSWTVIWKWAEGREPDVLRMQVDTYYVPEEVRGQYREELQRWVKDAWL